MLEVRNYSNFSGDLLRELADEFFNLHEEDYCVPKHFERIAHLWERILGVPVDKEQVALMLIAMHITLINHHPYKNKKSIIEIIKCAAALNDMTNYTSEDNSVGKFLRD